MSGATATSTPANGTAATSKAPSAPNTTTAQHDDNTTEPGDPQPNQKSKKKKKRTRSHSHAQTPTAPLPPSLWTYLHIHLLYSTPATKAHASPPPLDVLAVRTLLTQAFAQFLGHIGAAIPVDILKVEEAENEAWIRVPREDGRAVVAALGQFVGYTKGRKADGEQEVSAVSWKVKGWDDWLGRLVMGGKEGGADLFVD